MQKERPNTSQSKPSALKGCIFVGSQHLQKSVQNIPQKAPRKDRQILKIATGGLPKTMPNISIRIVTNKMHENQIWEPRWPKIASQNGLRPLTFWGLLRHCLRNCLWEAPGLPKSWPDRKQHDFCVTFSMDFCICCSMRFV